MLGPDLEDCLIELPSLGNVQQQGTNVEAPVRSVEIVDSIYGDGALSPPVGGIYCVTYANSSKQEIFVPGDPLERRKDHLFDYAQFLKAGRVGDKIDEVQRLLIPGAEGVVPHHIKQAIEFYEDTRERLATEYLAAHRHS